LTQKGFVKEGFVKEVFRSRAGVCREQGGGSQGIRIWDPGVKNRETRRKHKQPKYIRGARGGPPEGAQKSGFKVE